MLRWFFILFGALGMAWFLLPVCTALIVNIGNVTGVIVFGLILCGAIWNKALIRRIRTLCASSAGSVYFGAIVCIILCIFLLAGVLGVQMIRACAKQDQEDRTLVLLGCGVYGERPSLMLVERMQKAYEWMETHPDSVCVLSGGKGAGEQISEAEAMYRWLTTKGIVPSRLYKEDQSTSTRENLLYTKKILQQENLSKRIRIVTNEFHEYRAGVIADKLELDHCALPAGTAWWLFPTYVVREMYGILSERFF